MLLHERRRARIEAVLDAVARPGDAHGLLAFLMEPVAPLPWGQESTPEQELVHVALPMPEGARLCLASCLLDIVAGHVGAQDAATTRAVEGAAYAVGMLDVDLDTDALRRFGTSVADAGVASHCLRSAHSVEARRGPLDGPDPFWLALLASGSEGDRATAAHAILARAKPADRDAALRLGLSANIGRTATSTLAHRWASSGPTLRPDLPADLLARLADGLRDSGHDMAGSLAAAEP